MARSRGPKKAPVKSTYEKATDVRDIAVELITRHGMSLRDAHIEYYMRSRTRDGVLEPPRAQDAKSPGKASAGNPRDQKMLKRHFVIEVNGNWWDAATAEQREALVYHLLCHCWFTEGKPKIVPHEFQGFTSEVRHYGAWSKELAEFENAMKQQVLPLEPGEPPAEEAKPAKKGKPTKAKANAAAADPGAGLELV
jgi:hypothetical protein